MKKVFVVTCLVLLLASVAFSQCVNIQSGALKDSQGNTITTGYDKWGYNYQAHIFNGLYDNFSRPATPYQTGTMNLVMKWSDDWLANKDCNQDGMLDRGLDLKNGVIPEPAQEISKGWCTNHFEGDYEYNGEMYHYTEEVKMVYVGPAPVSGPDPWVNNRIWGSYAIVEDVVNDPTGYFYSSVAGQRMHGNLKELLVNPAGLGRW